MRNRNELQIRTKQNGDGDNFHAGGKRHGLKDDVAEEAHTPSRSDRISTSERQCLDLQEI
ncbi:hypothetical protein A2U01_0078427 [Trifolium medium]|uniref:Uncharacterized protein n=1 Tax=Trifolium medium TaxID=97028 RepID=A0A392TAM4_9FABA|nr:hypothetical protein [Trifolium medium]